MAKSTLLERSKVLRREKSILSPQLLDGHANQPDPALWATLEKLADPFVEARKGRLYLLVAQGTDIAVPAEVCRRYYSSASCDILPSLRSALMAVYLASPEARKSLPIAVVIHGLDMYAVGTTEGAIWLVHSDRVKELLSSPTEAWVSEEQKESRSAEGCAPALYNVWHRLRIGDSLVITTREAAKGLNPGKLRRAISAGGLPADMARAVARLAERGARVSPVPVTVIRVPGLSPIPDLGPARSRIPADLPTEVPVARRTSPIGPALILALVVIMISLWIKRPSLTRENLSALVGWLLTPVPTSAAGVTPMAGRTPSPIGQSAAPSGQSQPKEATTYTPSPKRTFVPSLTPSPTVRQEYAMPELRYPLEGEKVRGSTLTLRWVWAGSLAEDEYFDVRLWQEGTPKRGIAWTKNREYTQRCPGPGGYYWTVVVIRGKEGLVMSELSQEPKPAGFEWQLKEDTVTPTYVLTVAPTRATPVIQPTRITATPATTASPLPTSTP